MSTYEQALEDIEAARRDVEGDGHDWDVAAYDVIHSVIYDYPDDVRREVLRTQLGLGIFPDDPDPLAPPEPIMPRSPAFDRRVKARVAENRRKAYYLR